MSPAAKWEYMKEVYPRYHQAARAEKKRILDEFCKTYRCHRKHAIRLLNGPIPSEHRPKRRGRRTYNDSLISLLKAVWKAAGYPWSARLKVILKDWMPWIEKHYRPTDAQKHQLLSISSAQIDRRLAGEKLRLRKRIYGTTRPGTLLKHQIPIKTDSWNVEGPGYLEIDLVSHSGDSAEGDFAQSLNATDIYTTWTECVALPTKGQDAVIAAMDILEADFPFPILGLDSDNGSEFINERLWRRCQERHIQFTRGRPYKKDDNAHIEQKNWTHVRKLLGYVRYDTPEAVEAINDLYRIELRQFQNFFQPSVRLLKKIRIGSRLKRVYDVPKTPWDRVRAGQAHDPGKIAALALLRKSLDPFELAKAIDRKLSAIYRQSSSLKVSQLVPRILPAQNRKPHAAFNAKQPFHPRGVPESTVSHNWTNDRDNPLAKFRKNHAKEKFLAAG